MLCDRDQFGEDYLAVIAPTDKQWHPELRTGCMWIKHQIAHYVNPKVIVELGVRAGYSAWAMLKAVPSANYFGYDNYASGDAALASWAFEILEPFPNVKLVIQNIYEEEFVPPPADLYHIDADHRYPHEKRDVLNCIEVGTAKSVFSVHDFATECVWRAVMESAEEHDLTVCEILSNNGDAVLVHGEMPGWVFFLGRGARLRYEKNDSWTEKYSAL